MMQDYSEIGVPEWARNAIFRTNLIQGVYYLRENQGAYEWSALMDAISKEMATIVSGFTFHVRCLGDKLEFEINCIISQNIRPAECLDYQICWDNICREVVIPLFTLEGQHCGNLSDLTPFYIGSYTDEDDRHTLKFKFEI